MACYWITAVVLAGFVAGAPSPATLKSDITLLVDNDLQGPSSPQAKASVLILNAPHSVDDAAGACAAVGEDLWSPEPGVDIQPLLNFLSYKDSTGVASVFWAKNGTVTAQGIVGTGRGNAMLPVMCTQTAPYSNDTFQDTSSKWQVSVEANNEILTGYRDHLSFRFLGIRYAPQPKRFTYSEMYKGSGGNASALTFGSQCVQGGGGSEDCLFLNVWTTKLPAANSKAPLKPVMFWIHGGAFTGGTGSDPTFDGGNLASRGDVVLVTINYRLTTLGFLALPDGKTKGNFGLADQILALDWVRDNIAAFGGDPERITVFGQSAGAGSVRAMMASPKAKGKFAAAIPMSNLGGLAYGTTYSEYYTIPQEMTAAGNAILAATNCTNATSQVDCLRDIPAATLASLSTVARYVVVDGTYITTPQLELGGDSDCEAPAPATYSLMMGTMAEDGAPFIGYTRNIQPAGQSSWLAAQGLPVPNATLYPPEPLANATLAVDRVGARLATDAIFRCIDQATVYAGLETGALGSKVWYYEFDRAYQTSGWPGLNLCEPAPDAAHPYGDPEVAEGYLRCHSGELMYVFGTLARMGKPYRDERDLPFERYVLDVFSSFARDHDPNPDGDYLSLRGYQSTMDLLAKAGTWAPSVKGKMQTRILDWPGQNLSVADVDFPAASAKDMMSGFRDVEQCAWLGLGLDYYL